MADGTARPIEQVRAGDRVVSFDPSTGRTVTATVTAMIEHGPESSANGFVVLNGNVRVTPNHPIWVNGRSVRADAVRAGDSLITAYSSSLSTTSIAVTSQIGSSFSPQITTARGAYLVQGGENTYDLKVEAPGFYYIHGLLVNQKQIQ
jgi:hypothetical protein